MQDVAGIEASKWCAGCHDHAVFFNGRFDRPIKEQIDTPEAQAGLACTSCHAIVHVGSSMGQGDFTVEYPPLHDLAASDHPVLRRAHDALIHLAPEPHRDTFLKPFHRDQTAEFCSTLPQGAPRRAGERIPLVPRLQRLRQLAGVGRVGTGRALVLLPGEAAEVRRLSHAAREVVRSGGEERVGAIASLPGREHRLAVRQRRRRAAESRPGLSPRRADLGGRVRDRTRRRAAARRQHRQGKRGRAADRQHVRRRRGVVSNRRGRGRDAGGRRARPARQDRGSGPARRIGPRRGGRPHAQGGTFLSRRHR